MNHCTEDAVGRLLFFSTMAVKKYLEARLKPYDLTTEQFQVLKHLETESGVTQNIVCVGVGKSPANITRILDRLENKQYIERRDNPEDRRSSLVYLTGEGRALINEVVSMLSDFEARITAGIEGEELTELKSNLKKIQQNIANQLDQMES